MTDKPTAQRKTRVLIALYYYYPYVSGVTLYAKWVAEGLAQHGYDVTVLTSRHDPALAKTEVINGVKVVRERVLFTIGKGVIMPTFWLSMIRLANKSDYVNVHLPMTESGLASLCIPKRKIISTYQCDIYLGAEPLSRAITALSMAVMKLQLWRSRTIVSITRDYFEHSKMRRFSGKLVAIYPPVPKPAKVGNPQRIFTKFGVAPGEVKIGFVGRIVYEKGLQYLLEAIPYLQSSLPKFRVILLGDYSKVAGGSIKDQLDAYMQQYPDTVVFTGYLDDADRDAFYAGLDVFVLPSIDPLEAFGIVQVEAMLGGTPVVASDLPGVREVVKKTGYGRISRPRDPEDIARQIVKVVKNPQQYRPSPNEVAQYFNSQKAIKAHMEIMPKVV